MSIFSDTDALIQPLVREFKVQPRDGIERRSIFYLIIGIAVARIVASILLPVYDDCFISLRYGKNLAEGLGFVYNAHQHVLGETCPMFGVIEAGLFLLHLPMPGAVLVLNILSDVGIFLITASILRKSGHQLGIPVFAIGLALNPIMARICVGCMEMDLFLLVSLIAIYLYHQERRYSAIAVASAAYFLRPEAVLLVGVLCVLEASQKRYRASILMAILSLAVVAGPLYWIWSYYGSIISQSVTAKARAEHTPYFVILRELIFNDPLQIVLFVLALWGVRSIWKKGGFVRTVAIWIAVYSFAYLGYRAFVYSWYGEPIHYGILLLAAMALEDVARRLMIFSMPPRSTVAAVASATMVVLSIAAYAIVGRSKITSQVYEPIQHWCESHPNGHATILAGDIGAIGYFSGDYIYDAVGLVWRDALNYRSENEMIDSTKPVYMLLNAARSTTELFRDSSIASRYTPVAKFPSGPIRLDSLPDKWVQEYILFARK